MAKIISLFRAIHAKIHNFFYITKNKNCVVGSSPAICGAVDIYGNGRIIIGDHVRINSGKWCNPIGGDTRMLLAAEEGASIVIGNNVAMSNSAIIARGGFKSMMT